MIKWSRYNALKLSDGSVNNTKVYSIAKSGDVYHLTAFKGYSMVFTNSPFASSKEAKSAAKVHLTTGVLPINQELTDKKRNDEERFRNVIEDADALIAKLKRSIKIDNVIENKTTENQEDNN